VRRELSMSEAAIAPLMVVLAVVAHHQMSMAKT
jgi:hypothetical protein